MITCMFTEKPLLKKFIVKLVDCNCDFNCNYIYFIYKAIYKVS